MMRDRPSAARVADLAKIERFRDRPVAWLTFTGAACLSLYRERLHPVGLKPSWVTALAIIAERPGLSQSELGRSLAINRASSMVLSGLLEDAGLISRTNMTGRPRVAIMITATGQEKLDVACQLEDDLVEDCMRFLDAEERQLFLSTMRKIMTALDKI